MKKKISLIMVCLLFVLECMFSLIACGTKTNEPTHKHTFESAKWAYNDTYHWHKADCGHDVAAEDSDGYAKHIIENGECSVCDYVEPLTIEQFATGYKATAVEFVTNKIRPSVVVGEKQVKAEYYYIVGNDNNELTKVNIVWTYASENNKRNVELATVTLPTAISFRSIVNNDYSIKASALDIDRTDIFEFDAKANYDNKELASALFNRANIETTTAYPNSIYAEVESSNEIFRTFELLAQTENQITVKRIRAEKDDGTDEALINRLNRPTTTVSTLETYDIEGKIIYTLTYTLENIKDDGTTNPGQPQNPSNPTQPSGKIESVQDLIDKYGEEVEAALEGNYLYNLGYNIIGRAFRTERVLSTEWFINSGESISKIEVIMKYDEGNGYTSFNIGNIDLDSYINVKDLTKDTIASVLADNATNAIYALSYIFIYNDQMATQRTELKNAICDKFFGENEDITRIIKDEGYRGTDPVLGEVRDFTVIQISEDNVKEISISIKNSSSDSEYISKLSNASNHRTYSEKTYDISGIKLTA